MEASQARSLQLQPLLDSVLHNLCSQLHTCDVDELCLVARALVRMEGHGHLLRQVRDGEGFQGFLAALDAALAARLANRVVTPPAVAAVAYALAVCKWQPSGELQARIAAWLLVERKAGARAVEDKGACARVPRERSMLPQRLCAGATHGCCCTHGARLRSARGRQPQRCCLLCPKPSRLSSMRPMAEGRLTC